MTAFQIDPAIAAPWVRLRRRLRWHWWAWLALAVFGGGLFLHNLDARDPLVLAIFLLIPLLSLRQAWRADRRIVACNVRLRLVESGGPAPLSSAVPDLLEQPMSTAETTTQTATFAAGCFWGVDEMFRKVPGVVSTRVGYTAGQTPNATYEQVCSGRTGHAEPIEIAFDPSRVTYQQLLELFFENHDPTTLNRQGPDVGTQYRSGVYTHTPEQQAAAEAEVARRNASGDYAKPVVTEVEAAGPFYAAEEYHQKYFQRRGANWSCHFGNGKRRQVAAH